MKFRPHSGREVAIRAPLKGAQTAYRPCSGGARQAPPEHGRTWCEVPPDIRGGKPQHDREADPSGSRSPRAGRGYTLMHFPKLKKILNKGSHLY